MSDEIKETAAATQAAAEAEAPAAEAAAVDNKRKKTGRYIPNGIAFIHATFNNTKVAFTSKEFSRCLEAAASATLPSGPCKDKSPPSIAT